MKARPILFSSPMIQALIAGRKTQSRRIMKPQPEQFADSTAWRWKTCSWTASKPHCPLGTLDLPIDYSPYGHPGDLLWVREAFSQPFRHDPGTYGEAGGVICRADCGINHQWTEEMKVWKPSIHMPRWASRLTLEITEVRVERLQDISEADAEAEGVFRHIAEHSLDKIFRDQRGPMAIKYYRELWDSINGSWDANPWVWVLSLKVHHQNIDAFLKGKAA